MASGERFNKDEVTLCTYAALYDADDFGGLHRIESLTGRSTEAIELKVRNLAWTLDEEGIPRHNDISPLSGRPPGKSGRRTNWDIVEPLTRLSRSELLQKCRSILEEKEKERK